ncbi:Thoeris anti-defense Tad2 family protein [Phascolarctobacterium faecium]|uniref:Thoeris anti-defense Tad2 family protein n=1 Tax=Phascolarctobacterium faecium TaxID=33025 RepID=UPI003AB6BF5F
MKFGKALELMKQGEKVKRPHWSGFWQIEGSTVMMYCKDGRVLDIRNPDDVIYTLENIAAEDWEIV